ncbi:ubiquinol-cytochrome C chaperone family protein [Oceanibaculum indicum]|nr:ubiquinol-cytochrome C chaperone family protein [Oceanibaculum indicum]
MADTKRVFMPFSKLFSRTARRRYSADSLYLALVALAREPRFYTELGVPDTVDGRFEMLSLFVYLALRRLRREGEASARFSQELFDTMFADMDQSLRELGAGDLGVAPRIKRMAEGFYGRIAAYDKALEEGDGALVTALSRNLYGTVKPDEAVLARMAAIVRQLDGLFAGLPAEALYAGEPQVPLTPVLDGQPAAEGARI